MAETRQYLYMLRPRRQAMLSEGPTESEAAAVSRHFEHLRDLTRRGVVLLAGRTLNTDPSSFGIVIFTAAGDAEAEALMRADPAVAAEVMDATLFPYRIALLAAQEAVV